MSDSIFESVRFGPVTWQKQFPCDCSVITGKHRETKKIMDVPFCESSQDVKILKLPVGRQEKNEKE